MGLFVEGYILTRQKIRINIFSLNGEFTETKSVLKIGIHKW